jgi:hypothetical protein
MQVHVDLLDGATISRDGRQADSLNLPAGHDCIAAAHFSFC